MKALSILAPVAGLAFMGSAHCADITLYYSPTCPHCHHAREFIENTLVYEYPQLNVTNVNVMDPAHLDMFRDALKQCEYDNGGVPVLVVGDKCFQGYGDMMQDEIRTAIEADMSDADKNTASQNRASMESNAAGFRSSHAERANAIHEYTSDNSAQKKTKISGLGWMYVLLAALVVGMGIILVKRKK